MVGTLVMAPKSITFRRHDHLVSVLFGDLFSHSYNITFSMFLYLVECNLYQCIALEVGFHLIGHMYLTLVGGVIRRSYNF